MILQHNHLIVRAEVTQPPKSIEEVTKWVTELVKLAKILIFPVSRYLPRVDGRSSKTGGIPNGDRKWISINISPGSLNIRGWNKVKKNVVLEK